MENDHARNIIPGPSRGRSLSLSHGQPVPSQQNPFREYFLGRFLFFAGAAGLIYLILTQSAPDQIPDVLPFPSSLLAMFSFASIIWGLIRLWRWSHPHAAWAPTQPGQRFHALVVYSRPDCHLCEEAVEILEHYRKWLPAVSEINIEEDDTLLRQFDLTVPVVEFDGVIRFQGRVDELLLKRLIEGTPPQPHLRQR
ncbi:glutaredoxin family protein [Planctomicrobium sp. SH664]|uniref:glutaredoxin family protein n=1 Tax=Planctomicrobium sp. SH664 TaxID=3448125 RepID=UPI003F5B14B2